MANLTFAVSKDGLIAPVLVGLKGETVTELHAKGLPIPSSVICRGLVDTGSSSSAVAPWIIQRLGLGPGIPAKSQTASGTVDVEVHWASLAVLNPNQGQPDFTIPTVVVSTLATELEDADVLIGLNALLECNLFLEGSLRRFTFAF